MALASSKIVKLEIFVFLFYLKENSSLKNPAKNLNSFGFTLHFGLISGFSERCALHFSPFFAVSAVA